MAAESGPGVLSALLVLLERPPARGPVVTVRASHDFFGPPWWTPDQVGAVEDEYAGLYRVAVAEVAVAWGKPDLVARRDRPGWPPWCNAAEVSGWRRGGRLACVWWGHEDKELPVVLDVCVVPPEWEA